uniref:Pyridoxal-dependent decarboxylase n=1 Tax=Streptomyces sp. NRRL 30471 TaxID=996287 RepID=F2WUD5_9ACTN|nr:pyridoxal-dependent decarboxylase [Streptomyces sp. NRRL 30471]
MSRHAHTTSPQRWGTGFPAPMEALRCVVAAAPETPTIVHDPDGIDAEITAIRHGLSLLHVPGSRLLFSVKANRSRAVLTHLASRNIGAAVSSVAEDRAAAEAGMSPRYATSPGLSGADLIELHKSGTHLDIDSIDQLAAVPRHSETGLRLSVPIPRESTARDMPWSRFGIRWEDAGERGKAQAVLKERKLRVVRLHAHVRDIGGVEDVRPLGRALAHAARDLPEVDEVNIGGGMIRLFHHNQEAIAPVFECLAEELARAGRPLRVLAEPGAQLVTSHGYLITRVLSVRRHEGRQSVTVDASAWNLAGWSRFHLAMTGADRGERWTTDLTGPTCYEKDLWFAGMATDRIEPGDLVVLRGAGAYVGSMLRVLHGLAAPGESLLGTADGAR